MGQAGGTAEKCRSAFIALGSNENSAWGDPTATIQKATSEVSLLSTSPPLISRFFTNPAYPAGAGPDFINAAIRVHTHLSPDALLATLHGIEAAAGRVRATRWGQRTLDLDLIAMDDLVLPDQATHAHWRDMALARQVETMPGRLILPHPRMQDRAFVLVPLADIAADWMHPVLGRSVHEMLNARPAGERASVVALD